MKKYDGSVKGGVPVAEISAVSLSSLPDNFVVVHTKEGMRDLIMGIGQPGVDKLSEFVTIIAGLHKQVTQKPLPVNFATRYGTIADDCLLCLTAVPPQHPVQ